MKNRGKRSLWYRLDKLSVYLPALAMAVLALATFWLARSAPSFVQDEDIAIVSEDPDYRMADFAVRSYAQSGRLVTEIHGDSGRHFPLTDILEVDNIRLRSIAENSRVTTAKADTGTSNGNGTEMSLRGNAVVVQQAFGNAPQLEFHGEELLIWPEEERVQSSQPVTLVRGADRMTGDSLDYDKTQQVVEIKGRVRSTLQPGSSSRLPNR